MSENYRRKANTKSSIAELSAFNAHLSLEGLRPIQIWVPDTRQPAFLAEAARQSALVSQSAFVADDQAFVDAISELKFS